jgi:hypothetical protein
MVYNEKKEILRRAISRVRKKYEIGNLYRTEIRCFGVEKNHGVSEDRSGIRRKSIVLHRNRRRLVPEQESALTARIWPGSAAVAAARANGSDFWERAIRFRAWSPPRTSPSPSADFHDFRRIYSRICPRGGSHDEAIMITRCPRTPRTRDVVTMPGSFMPDERGVHRVHPREREYLEPVARIHAPFREFRLDVVSRREPVVSVTYRLSSIRLRCVSSRKRSATVQPRSRAMRPPLRNSPVERRSRRGGSRVRMGGIPPPVRKPYSPSRGTSSAPRGT